MNDVSANRILELTMYYGRHVVKTVQIDNRTLRSFFVCNLLDPNSWFKNIVIKYKLVRDFHIAQK